MANLNMYPVTGDLVLSDQTMDIVALTFDLVMYSPQQSPNDVGLHAGEIGSAGTVSLEAAISAGTVIASAIAEVKAFTAGTSGSEVLAAALAELRRLAAASSGSEAITAALGSVSQMTADIAGAGALTAAIGLIRGLTDPVAGTQEFLAELGITGGAEPPVTPSRHRGLPARFVRKKRPQEESDDEYIYRMMMASIQGPLAQKAQRDAAKQRSLDGLAIGRAITAINRQASPPDGPKMSRDAKKELETRSVIKRAAAQINRQAEDEAIKKKIAMNVKMAKVRAAKRKSKAKR